MVTEKRLISVGDVVYVIGRYSFTPDERPKVVEAQVAFIERKRLHAYVTKGHGSFSFAQSDLGKTVFWDREDAERVLRRCLDASD